ncbi:MAG: hypothetical protein LBU22_08750 [Dysgonamonadaceae bacterium]|jgi:hypothetical protein|nr:hypothetical protein [Dysgonamonadaceae bacterium]
MKNNWLKYRLFFLLAAVALIDSCFGILVDFYTAKHPLPGDYLKIEYLMKSSDEDMLIIGSSVTINAYIPQIMEDSLGLTCFNGGCNSQTLPFYQCMVERILSRYSPSYIVLSMRKDDLFDGSLGFINLLKPYYGKGYASIDYFLDKQNGRKSIFLHSNLYRYNTIGCRILLHYLQSAEKISRKGFEPHAVPKYPPTLINHYEYASAYRPTNPELEACFLKIVDLCRQSGVRLIVTSPPLYIKLPGQGNSYEFSVLENLCKAHDVPFINDSQSAFFLSRPDLFHDNSHLNYRGSEIYTNRFINELREKRAELSFK